MKSQGFTLIEMMIALVIIGALTALSLPMFETGIINSKVRGAAESLQNGLRLARQTAAMRNSPVRFLLSTKESQEEIAGTGKNVDCGSIIGRGVANDTDLNNANFWAICAEEAELREGEGKDDDRYVGKLPIVHRLREADDVKAKGDQKFVKISHDNGDGGIFKEKKYRGMPSLGDEV